MICYRLDFMPTCQWPSLKSLVISLIFSHYRNTGQNERAHSLIVWVVTALQAAVENRQRLYIVRPFTPETVRLAYMRAKANATGRYYIIPEAP